jgi:NAD(P)-dependent dehydrogenase (short-subunit alcohol dehydrogenase family)
MFILKDKIILLTGAAGHLGSAMARGFAQAGGYVYLNGRNPSSLEKLCDEIEAGGGKAAVLSFDVTDCAAVSVALQTIEERHGRLDVLVNNAYAGKGGTLEQSSDEDFTEAYHIAVTAAAGLIRSALPLLRQSALSGGGGASVINVASMYGLVSPDLRVYDSAQGANPPFYGAAKAALLQLTRYLACELAKDKIRVNALCPGPFPSPAVCDSSPEFVEKLADKVPLGRIGVAVEIAGPAVFLASDAASYVTGATLPVDGGWTAW